MSDTTYMQKEEARMALVTALQDYYKAAETDGLDVDDMSNEIEEAAREAGIMVDVLVS